MFFWKVDEETIRCLINKQEIGNMGFDVNEIAKDEHLMQDFLDAIIESSRDYVQWDTGNGVQNFNARALPADQFLLTISCTFMDDAIDKDLAQILKMTSALNHKISEERIRHILTLSGKDKEEAFRSLTKDLTEAVGANLSLSKNEEIPTEQSVVSRKLIYQSFDRLVAFCNLINGKYRIDSDLYKIWDMYVLVVRFPDGTTEEEAEAFSAIAMEHGADVSDVLYENYFLGEQGKTMMTGDAVEELAAFA